jgi:hypothetical protein
MAVYTCFGPLSAQEGAEDAETALNAETAEPAESVCSENSLRLRVFRV